jgi:hypothetical protein
MVKRRNRIAINAENLDALTEKMRRVANPIEYTVASIKDDFCNFSYKIIEGIGAGMTHDVKGKGHIISMDLKIIFSRLNIHLAILDNAFKLANETITDLETMHGHGFAHDYIVTGFKISGTTEDEKVVLSGWKYVQYGIIKFDSPKVTLVGEGGYEWKQQLRDTLDKCREEVRLYHNGKYTELEVADQAPDPAQPSLFPEGGSAASDEDEFANAKVEEEAF